MSIIRNGFQDVDLDVPVVLPTLNLDFANSQELDPRITFSRGSIGTFVNKNGLIETAAANIPRFDYDPISGECRGLLIEESRTNYFWGTQTGNGGSVTNGTATGADGVTAKKFVPTLGSTAFPSIANYSQYAIPAGSQVAGGTVDISFSGYFAAVADGLYVPDIVVSISSSGTNYIFAELLPNLSNGGIVSKSLSGAVGWSELIAPQITLMPFGMYKVTWSVRYTQGATIRNLVDFGIQCRRKNSPSGATGTYYADGVNGFQFSCVQYEIGAFPTSYIPTTTSSVTRSADVPTMTGTNFSSWYNQTESTIFCKFNAYQLMSTVQRNVIDIRGTETLGLNRVQLQLNGSGGGAAGQPIYHNLYQNGPNFADYFGFSYTTGPTKNIMRYKDLDTFVASKDGNIRRNTTSRITTVPLTKTMNTLTFGTFNGAISKFAYYPRALNDAEIQYLTQ